jgi:spermidine synthase
MFAHPNPKRVAIVGGGEGATLREVLKHNTVERAVMIEIDEEMVSISRQYLPEWSDCTDLVGSTSWCGDDPRTQMVYGDALGWLIERFHDKENITEGLFDVIIMDAL